MGENSNDSKAIGSLVGSLVTLACNFITDNPVVGLIVVAAAVCCLVLGIQALRAGQNKVMAWIGVCLSGFMCLIFFAAFIAGMVMAMAQGGLSV